MRQHADENAVFVIGSKRCLRNERKMKQYKTMSKVLSLQTYGAYKSQHTGMMYGECAMSGIAVQLHLETPQMCIGMLCLCVCMHLQNYCVLCNQI